MCHPLADRAEEIAPFRLMGVDGDISSRLMRDEFVSEQPGRSASRQSQFDLRQEVRLMTHSYVYHPNFLLLDLGGGPILQSGRSETDTSDTSSKRTLYNFSARATLLRDKPYRGAVFYEHLNPTLNIAPGEVMNQESTRYGLEAYLLDPVTPVPMAFQTSRTHFSGTSPQRMVDDQIDQMSLRGTWSHGTAGSTQLRWQETRQTSASGSVNLPIQSTGTDTRDLSADTRLGFGPDKKYELNGLVNFSQQDYTFLQSQLGARKDLRALLTARARHDGGIQSYGNMTHTSSSQGNLDSSLDALTAGVTMPFGNHVQAGAGMRRSETRGNQLNASTYGADGSLQYQRKTSLGSVNAGYAIRYTARDQQAGAPQITVVGEQLRLVGTTQATLANSRVIASTIVVSNTARTQSYVEGLDYVVTVLGLQTRLQRLIGGNILDGQDLLVDYAYDAGGTFGYSQLDNNLNIGWNPTRVLGLTYRYASSSPRLTSGTPTSPLNTIRDHTLGARIDLPIRFGMEMSVGGSMEFERHRETLAPFQRTSTEGYVEFVEPLFGRGNVRLTARQQNVDYETSTQDVNLAGFDLRAWTRLDSGITLLADIMHERDDGSPITRTRNSASFRALWRYRRFSLSADFRRLRETQGDTARDRTLLQVYLKREFGR